MLSKQFDNDFAGWFVVVVYGLELVLLALGLFALKSNAT